MAGDVLSDSEDLLHQLSAELGLPTLLDYTETQVRLSALLDNKKTLWNILLHCMNLKVFN